MLCFTFRDIFGILLGYYRDKTGILSGFFSKKQCVIFIMDKAIGKNKKHFPSRRVHFLLQKNNGEWSVSS